MLNQYISWEFNKSSSSVLAIEMSIFTSKFNKLLLGIREPLNSYIDKAKDSKILPKLKSTDPLSPNNNSYYLHKILNSIDIEFYSKSYIL